MLRYTLAITHIRGAAASHTYERSFMRFAYPPTTWRRRVHGCAAWLAVLLLLPVVTAQGQVQPGIVEPEQPGPETVPPGQMGLETVAPGQTPAGYVLPVPTPPTSIEPLRLRFFPPVDTTGNPRGLLTPFLSIGERYDDNIFLAPSRAKTDDFVTLPGGGIRLRYRPSL